MSVNKITSAPTANELIDKVNEVIDNLGGGGGSSTLSGLSDVTITSATNGQVLTYDSVNSKWVNTSVPTNTVNTFTNNTGTTLNTQLTLNSPLIFRNGVLLTSTTDYTISGSVITFVVALVSSDIINVLNSVTTGGGGGVSRNIGEIVTSSVPLSDPNLHLLDGSLLTSTDYPEFVTAIDNVYNSSPVTSATYNVTEVGSLTSNNGVYSGFSSSKYLKTTVSFKPGTSTWEICIGFNTVPSTSYDQSIFCKYRTQNYYGLRIIVGSVYKMYYLISSDNNTGLIVGEDGVTTLQPNTDYLVKVSFDGSKYLAQLSTDDGQTWITDLEVVSSTPMYDWTADTTLGYFAGTTERYMRGSININKAYFKINGDYVWKGATINPAGFIDENSWQGEVTAYGSCGKFVYDSTNHTVRLPKIDCVLEGTSDTEQIGTISQYLYSTGTNALNTAKTLYYIVVK